MVHYLPLAVAVVRGGLVTIMSWVPVEVVMPVSGPVMKIICFLTGSNGSQLLGPALSWFAVITDMC